MQSSNRSSTGRKHACRALKHRRLFSSTSKIFSEIQFQDLPGLDCCRRKSDQLRLIGLTARYKTGQLWSFFFSQDQPWRYRHLNSPQDHVDLVWPPLYPSVSSKKVAVPQSSSGSIYTPGHQATDQLLAASVLHGQYKFSGKIRLSVWCGVDLGSKPESLCNSPRHVEESGRNCLHV